MQAGAQQSHTPRCSAAQLAEKSPTKNCRRTRAPRCGQCTKHVGCHTQVQHSSPIFLRCRFTGHAQKRSIPQQPRGCNSRAPSYVCDKVSRVWQAHKALVRLRSSMQVPLSRRRAHQGRLDVLPCRCPWDSQTRCCLTSCVVAFSSLKVPVACHDKLIWACWQRPTGRGHRRADSMPGPVHPLAINVCGQPVTQCKVPPCGLTYAGCLRHLPRTVAVTAVSSWNPVTCSIVAIMQEGVVVLEN
jgi:hypothetical protein